MRLLAPLLIASSIFGQDVIEEEIVFHVTSPEVVACPPRYTPMNCQRSVEIEPDLWYQTCESEIRGNEYVWIRDDSGEERYVLMPDQLRFSTELEKWTNKRNEHVIDVRFRLTVSDMLLVMAVTTSSLVLICVRFQRLMYREIFTGTGRTHINGTVRTRP